MPHVVTAQLMPTVSYTQMPNEKGKDQNADGTYKSWVFFVFLSDCRLIARIVSKDNPPPPGTDASGPLQPELQFARCMSNRYRSEQFPRCVSCTRRWAGDTCRFQGIRFFLKDPQRNIVGISFVETQKPDAPSMTFPNKWNVPLQPLHIRRTKVWSVQPH
jgi:lysine-specific demethylase 3